MRSSPTVDELAAFIAEITWKMEEYEARSRDYWEEHARDIAKRLLDEFVLWRRLKEELAKP